MKRIDTVNARPDINGTGKAGFHDNSDISGQDATYIDPSWCNNVQEEICNLLEKNGVTLDAGVQDQLFQLLATQDDLIALAVATEAALQTERDQRTTAIAAVQSLANSNQNRITLLEQEVGNLRAMFNNQPSAQDILNLMYPVGSISLAAPLNGTGGVVWGGLGNTYDVNPYTYRRIS